MKEVLICLVFVVFLIGSVSAATYYVDVNSIGGACSDSNPGTLSQPWCTIQQAADTMVAGDTVYVRGGIYNERVALDGTCGTEGESGNPVVGYITYSSNTGETAILEPDPSWTWGAGFMSGRWSSSGICGTPGPPLNYIKIVGFEIRDYPENGIIFDRDQMDRDGSIGSHHIIIEDCVIHDSGSVGILFDGGDEDVSGEASDIILRNNTVYNNGGHGIKMINGEDPGILNRLHTKDSLVENNHIYSNGEIGIHSSTGSYNITYRNNIVHDNNKQGLSTHEAWNCLIEDNIVYNNGLGASVEDIGIVLWSSRNVTVRRNEIFNNTNTWGQGIRVAGSLAGGPAEHTIYSNLVYNNGPGNSNGGGIRVTGASQCQIYNNLIASNNGYGINVDSSGNIFNNNILYQNSLFQLSASSGNIFDYNLYYPDVSFGDRGLNDITGDPLFLNPSTGDFHLQPTSPAIDAGTDVGLSQDFDGNPIVGIPDIGAFEYQGFQFSCTSGVDLNFNGGIEIGELLTYISQWKSGSVVIGDLLTAIGEWKNGCS